jgi:NAD(P) transhydrogenase
MQLAISYYSKISNYTHLFYSLNFQISSSTLASNALLQGRTAASNIFRIPYNPINMDCIPFGIYSIPEIGMVGKTGIFFITILIDLKKIDIFFSYKSKKNTEKDLIAENVPYEIGVCKFNELPKGVMQGYILFYWNFIISFILRGDLY